MREETKDKRIVEKIAIMITIELGVPNGSCIGDIGLQEAAKRTLKDYKDKRWNTAYTTLIKKHQEDIEAIANGEKVKYVISTIYRDAETNLLEIEEKNA